VNPTRVPIETKESYRWLENLRQSMVLLAAPERCVHVADRESDIYELFCRAQDLGTRFLVRVQTNRLAEPPQDAPPQNAAHRVFAQLDSAPWLGRHRVTVGGEAIPAGIGPDGVGVAVQIVEVDRLRLGRAAFVAGHRYRARLGAAGSACGVCNRLGMAEQTG